MAHYEVKMLEPETGALYKHEVEAPNARDAVYKAEGQTGHNSLGEATEVGA